VADTIVGLDLGATGIRGVQVSRGKDGQFAVTQAAAVDLDPGIIKNGEVVDIDGLIDALKAFWKSSKFSTKNVAFGLSNGSVLVRPMDLPYMPAKDFKASLRYQVGDSLPVSVSDVNLDYHTLGEYVQKNEHDQATDMMRILLVAANTEMVEAFSDAVMEAGLTPVRADTIPFALIRLTTGGVAGGATDPIEVIVDLGADVINVIVHQGGQPRFVRTIASFGGNQVTDALMERFRVSYEQAEEIKQRVGLVGAVGATAPAPTESVFGGAPAAPSTGIDPQTEAALKVITPWAGAVIAEIRNSLDYFLSAYENVHLARVHLTGGGANMNGLVQRLSSELRLPVVPVDPFAFVTPKNGKQADAIRSAGHNMSVATGLAMGI
jgi:type IV pilus assembly protein PilM